MVITVYATDLGAAWSTRQLIWDTGAFNVELNVYGMRVALDIEKAGTLEFTVSPGHPYYNQFTKMKTVITVIADENDSSKKQTIFRGRISQIDTDIFKQKKITAEDGIAFLNDSIYIPSGKDISSTPRERFVAAINNHNSQMSGEPGKSFIVGLVSITTGIDDSKTYNDNSYSETSSYLKSELTDQYGGFFFVRYNDDYSTQTIDWLEQRDGATSPTIQSLVFGKNIVEYSREDHTDDLFTVLVPSGNDNLTINGYSTTPQTVTINDADGTKQQITVQPDGRFLKITSGVAQYGLIYKSESFSESTQTALFKEALDYIANNYHPTLHTFKIKAVDWHYIDNNVKQIQIGDIVTVIYDNEQHSDKLMCSAIDYDLMEPENTEFTLGLSEDSLSKKRAKEKKNEAKKSRKTASSVGSAAVRVSALEKAFSITDTSATLLGERTFIAKQVDADLFTGQKLVLSKAGNYSGNLEFDAMIGTLAITGGKDGSGDSTRIAPGYINVWNSSKSSNVFSVDSAGNVKANKVTSDSDVIAKKLVISRTGSDSGTITADSLTGSIKVEDSNHSTMIAAGYVTVLDGTKAVFRLAPSGKISVYDPVSETIQDLFQHQHTIVAEELSGSGKIRITLGDVNFPEKEGDNHADFDIASTKFYKTAMADAARKQSVYDIQYVSHEASFTNGIYAFTVTAKAVYDTGNVDSSTGEPVLSAMAGNNPDAVSFLVNPTEAIDYGKSLVSFNNYTYNSVDPNASLPESRTAYAHISNGKTKDLPLYLVQGVWSYNAKYVYLRAGGNSDSNNIAMLSIDASSVYKDGYDQGVADAGSSSSPSISITRGNRTSSQPSPQNATGIWTGNPTDVSSNNSFYTFKVTAGSSEKWYFFYVSV